MKALKSLRSKHRLQSEVKAKLTDEERNWRKSLDHDQAALESLSQFCIEFTRSLEQLYQLYAKFWDVMQKLEKEGAGFGQDPELATHLWAMRTGFEMVAPPAASEFQRNLVPIQKLTRRLKALKAASGLKDALWVEQEHYGEKLTELCKEQELGHNKASRRPRSSRPG